MSNLSIFGKEMSSSCLNFLNKCQTSSCLSLRRYASLHLTFKYTAYLNLTINCQICSSVSYFLTFGNEMSKKYLEIIEIIDLHICDPYLIVKIVNL